MRELVGHDGCVNRLAWSPDGALLASASDDRRLMLWQYGPPGAGGGANSDVDPGNAAAAAAAEPLVVPTPHDGNIFGVAFLPSERATLVTGAMDAAVCLIKLREDGGGDTAAARGGGDTAAARGGGAGPVDWRRVGAAAVTAFRCHRGCVKAVAADPGAPVFFSAAEDGACRQFDARAPAAAQAGWGAANVAAAPRRGGRRLELKGVDVNPARPEQLALAASDEIIRVYDRRRLTLAPPSGGASCAPLLALTPPHASLRAAGGAALEEPPPPHATHVSFAPRGDRLVANFHGDAVYAWRLGGAAEDASAAAATMRAPAARARRAGAPPPLPDARALLAAGAAALAALAPPRAGRRADPAAVAAALAAARAAYEAGDASGAIDVATRALRAAPRSVELLIARANALMRRGWFPDNMAALADLEAAAALDPRGRGGLGAAGQVQRVKVLLAVGLPRAAARALELHRAALGAPPPPDPAPGGGETGRRVRAFAHAAIGAGLDALAADVARDVAGSAAARDRARVRGAAARAARRRRSREFRRNGGGAGSGSGSGSDSDADDNGAGAALDALDGAYAEALSAAAVGAGAASASTSAAAVSQPPPALYAALPGGARAAGAYVGAFNCATDIKEATFLGEDGALVAAGSDDGRAWLFDAATGACLRALAADAEVVNCVRAHPVLPVLATSGIESTVRLWAPGAAPPARAGAELEARRGANVAAARRHGEARAGAGAGAAGLAGALRPLGGLNPQVLAALAARPELLARLLGGAAGGGEGGEEAGEAEEAEAEDEDEEEGLQGVAPNCRMA